MFRLSSGQIFKALQSPLRSLRSPLRLSSRHVHAIQVPFSGPPSYDTIARRFSSCPGPVVFFMQKSQQEARDRGEFIDIHDISGMNPKDYDVLITDVNDNILQSDVAEIMGIAYHAKATEADANSVAKSIDGIVYGPGLRMIFPCVVSHEDKAYWIFFIADSGAPSTYLSLQASRLLGIRDDPPSIVKIAGYSNIIHTSPENSHFAGVNLLGSDFMNAYDVFIRRNHGRGSRKAKLYFGQHWINIEKSKL